MGRLKYLIEQAEPLSSEIIKKELDKGIQKYGFDGIYVDDVEVDFNGNIVVDFVDSEDDEMTVVFDYDEDEGATAIILDDDDEDEDADSASVVIDLEGMAPAILKTPFGKYIDMTNLTWTNKSFYAALFNAGDIGRDDDEDLEGVFTQRDVERMQSSGNYTTLYTEVGQEESFLYEPSEIQIAEIKKKVVRGGKVVRLAVVRKRKKKKLSSKQRAALRKAARKRKQKKSKIGRKRKRSMKVRKRRGIKKSKLGKFRKVAGTANRKR